MMSKVLYVVIILLSFHCTKIWAINQENTKIISHLIIIDNSAEDSLLKEPFITLLENELFISNFLIKNIYQFNNFQSEKIVSKIRTLFFKAHGIKNKLVESFLLDTLKCRSVKSNQITDSLAQKFLVIMTLRKRIKVYFEVDLQWYDYKYQLLSRKYTIPIYKGRRDVKSTIAQKVARSIVLNLDKMIRIQIEPFSSTMRDTLADKLKSSVRYMLGTYLSKIPWIGIVDIKEDTSGKIQLNEQIKLQKRAPALITYYRPETAVKSGQIVFPNYQIHGNISQYGEQIRIDCWLTSIESQMVLAASGAAVDHYSMEKISSRIQEIAYELSRSIQRNQFRQKTGPEVSYAIVPEKNIRLKRWYKNRILEIITALNRFLKNNLDVEKVEIKEDYELIENYLNGKINFEEMIWKLGPTTLFILDIDEKQDYFNLSIKIQPIKNPAQHSKIVTLFNKKTSHMEDELNKFLNDEVFCMDSIKKNLKQNNKTKKEFGSNTLDIPQYFKKYRVTISYGFINRFQNGAAYLNNNANRVFMGFLNIRFKSLQHFRLGGIIAYDTGGHLLPWETNKGENNGDILIDNWFLQINAMWEFNELNLFGKRLYDDKFSIIGGVGPAVFFIQRIVGEGTKYKNIENSMNGGLGGFLGLIGKIYHNHNIDIFIDIRGGIVWAYSGKKAIKVRTIEHKIDYYHFKAGPLGGFYIISGFSFRL